VLATAGAAAQLCTLGAEAVAGVTAFAEPAITANAATVAVSAMGFMIFILFLGLS
jgi:hypothetical protein